MNEPLGLAYPDGCYLFFNAEIGTKSVEQLLHLVIDAIRNQFTNITLCISSAGGDADSSIYALNALKSFPVAVRTHNSGAVQSAAVTLFLAGAFRTAEPSSTFFFHQSSVGVDQRQANATNLAERLKVAKRHDERTSKIIADKIGGTKQCVQQWQRNELLMPSAMALEEGLIHKEVSLTIPKAAWISHVLV